MQIYIKNIKKYILQPAFIALTTLQYYVHTTPCSVCCCPIEINLFLVSCILNITNTSCKYYITQFLSFFTDSSSILLFMYFPKKLPSCYLLCIFHNRILTPTIAKNTKLLDMHHLNLIVYPTCL